MRVGLATPRADATLGGGYTFENDVFEALVRLQPESNHEFLGLLLSDNDSDLLQRFHVPQVDLRRSLAQRVRGRLLRNGKNLLHRLRLAGRPSLSSFWPYPQLKQAGVEFLIHGAVERFSSMDIPYLAVVWDIQHRLQPFFPEVSGDGEWESRERGFGTWLRRATFIVVGTEAAKRELQQFYGIDSERIRLLPHPTPSFVLEVPDRDVARTHLKRFAIHGDFAFYPAQFWPHKNHVLLISAWKILRDQYGWTPQLILSGADKGNLAYIQKKIGQAKLDDVIHAVGFVERNELISFYQNAIALVYPSLFGPENLPPLEAFALGCPVLAANVPGSEEQLGDAALRLNPTDAQAWADALWQIHKDEKLRTLLIGKGTERARRFTANNFARGLLDILDEFRAYRDCWPA